MKDDTDTSDCAGDAGVAGVAGVLQQAVDDELLREEAGLETVCV